MRRTGRIAVLAAGLAVTLAGGYLAADPASLPAPRPSDGPSLAGVARAFTELLDEAEVRATTRAQWAAVARASAIVVLNSWDYRLIPVLKRANPAVGVWVYKDLSGVRSDDCTTRGGQCGTCPPGVADSRFLSSGVGYCWLRRHHPDWLLRAAGTGGPFQFRDCPATWEADYALASLLLATDDRQLLAVGAFSAAPPPPRTALGPPLDAARRLGPAWRRSFAGGVVVVNPSTAGATVQPGGHYLGGAGRPVSAVVLPPASGAILDMVDR